MRCPECGSETVLATYGVDCYERVCAKCGLVLELVLREAREKEVKNEVGFSEAV